VKDALKRVKNIIGLYFNVVTIHLLLALATLLLRRIIVVKVQQPVIVHELGWN
jgi:hypothetical protein